MTHKREEGGDCEGFVAVTYDLKVDGVLVKEVREEGDCSVDGYHEEDAYDAVVEYLSAPFP